MLVNSYPKDALFLASLEWNNITPIHSHIHVWKICKSYMGESPLTNKTGLWSLSIENPEIMSN